MMLQQDLAWFPGRAPLITLSANDTNKHIYNQIAQVAQGRVGAR